MPHEHPDALPGGRARGRGAQLNPGNRFETVRLHVLGEALDEAAREQPEGSQVPTVALWDDTRSLLNRVESPDMPLGWTLNPYRGCEHGCIYCYARPTHETLGFSCGVDFETRIMVKRHAAAILRRELGHRNWKGEPIMLSGVTDAYQPLEEQLRVTRACLEVMAECSQPVVIVTKSKLVLRDLDLLRELAAHNAVSVSVSVTTLDNRLASKMEPRASSPQARLNAIRKLSEAGIPAGVMVAPVIPALTDHEMAAILEAASEAGARRAGYVLLRLPHQLRELFLDWLAREAPQRAAHVESAIRGARGGKLYDARWGERKRGTGARAEQIARNFEVFSRRFGFNRNVRGLSSAAFRRPTLVEGGQMGLFGA